MKTWRGVKGDFINDLKPSKRPIPTGTKNTTETNTANANFLLSTSFFSSEGIKPTGITIGLLFFRISRAQLTSKDPSLTVATKSQRPLIFHRRHTDPHSRPFHASPPGLRQTSNTWLIKPPKAISTSRRQYVHLISAKSLHREPPKGRRTLLLARHPPG